MTVRGGTSDPVLIYLILCVGDYPVVTLSEVRWVIDAGANVGYFAAFAAHHYPDAKVIAIEPEPSNFEALKANTEHYPQIIPLHAGLWSHCGTLLIDNPAAEKWCFRCVSQDGELAESSTSDQIEAVTIGSLQETYQINAIDVLKMDIEGGEREVFSASDLSWIDSVRIAIIELHPGCWQSLFKALETRRYDCRQVGENIVFLMGDLADKSGLLRSANG